MPAQREPPALICLQGDLSEGVGVPSGWRLVELGQVAALSRKSHDLKLVDQAQVPFIPMHLVPEGGSEITDWELRPTVDIRSGTFFRAGDLLLAKITPCLENGKQGVVREVPGGWGYASTEVFPIHPSPDVDVDFLDAYLRLPPVRRFLTDRMEGTTGRQRLPKSVLVSLPILLPPLSEQRAIAHVLRAVQQAKETTDAVIAATRELKRSLMRHLFTYGPVPVVDAEPAALRETEIGPVPEHWELKKLGDLAQIERGRFSHRPRNDPQFYGGSTPFIQTGDVVSGGGRIRSYSQTLNSRGLSVSRVFPIGTIVLTIAANIGYSGILEFEGAFPDSLVGITPDETIDTQFLQYYLETQQPEMDRLAPRGTQKNINIQFLKPWPTPRPPMVEQLRVAETLQRVDRKLTVEEERAVALGTLFTTLLHHLMAGKVRVDAGRPEGETMNLDEWA